MRKHAGRSRRARGQGGAARRRSSSDSRRGVRRRRARGLETALFLLSTGTSSDGRDIVIGTVLGLAVAAVLGVLVYQGSHLFDMRKFFLVTGALIILFAAGLLARAVLFLQASGDMGTWNNAVYNLTQYRWLTQQSQVGRFLAGIFGWDPRPSIEQVIAYFAYLLPVGFLYFRPVSSKTPVVAGAPVTQVEVNAG
jgi:high-affinity iron transporter